MFYVISKNVFHCPGRSAGYSPFDIIVGISGPVETHESAETLLLKLLASPNCCQAQIVTRQELEKLECSDQMLCDEVGLYSLAQATLNRTGTSQRSDGPSPLNKGGLPSVYADRL